MTTYQNILLIEDDTDDQEFFLEVLHDVDPRVKCVTALNGLIGLELLAKMPPKGTIVFLDLNLPMMSGMEVLEKIRKKKAYNEIPVVVLTTSKNFEQQCSVLGASLYLIKPSSEDLFHTILSVLLNNDVMRDCEFVRNLLEQKVQQQSP